MPKSRNHDRSIHNDLVADGADRLAEGIRAEVLPEIAANVRAEYADRLASVGVVRAIWLKWRMRGEVQRRVDAAIAARMPSEDALITASGSFECTLAPHVEFPSGGP